jgi:hypothetical protein
MYHHVIDVSNVDGRLKVHIIAIVLTIAVYCINSMVVSGVPSDIQGSASCEK